MQKKRSWTGSPLVTALDAACIIVLVVAHSFDETLLPLIESDTRNAHTYRVTCTYALN